MILLYAYNAPPYTAAWCAILLVGTLIGILRQKETMEVRKNYLDTGSAYPHLTKKKLK